MILGQKAEPVPKKMEYKYFSVKFYFYTIIPVGNRSNIKWKVDYLIYGVSQNWSDHRKNRSAVLPEAFKIRD